MPRGTEHEPFNRLGLLPTFTTEDLDQIELSSQQLAHYPDVAEILERKQ